MTTARTSSFTITNARYIAGKVASDLRQVQLHYGWPSDQKITDYLEEFSRYIAAGYLAWVEYGFARDGDWVLCLRYEVRTDGTVRDGGSGDVYARADVTGAHFWSYLVPSDAFWLLAGADQAAFKAALPIQRTAGPDRDYANGYWDGERGYASGGIGAARRVWRPA